MHPAPAVSFSVLRSRRYLLVCAIFLAVSIAQCASFLLSESGGVWRGLLLLGTSVVAGVAGCVEWFRAPQGVLRWDGRQWYWGTADRDVPCRVWVTLDFQSVVVVRMQLEQGVFQYLWLDEANAPPRWQALRRALLSRAQLRQSQSDQVSSTGAAG